MDKVEHLRQEFVQHCEDGMDRQRQRQEAMLLWRESERMLWELEKQQTARANMTGPVLKGANRIGARTTLRSA